MEERNECRWEIQNEDQNLGEWIILRWILEREAGVVLTGLFWLRIGIGGELL
jgi:hypothetical protein